MKSRMKKKQSGGNNNNTGNKKTPSDKINTQRHSHSNIKQNNNNYFSYTNNKLGRRVYNNTNTRNTRQN